MTWKRGSRGILVHAGDIFEEVVAGLLHRGTLPRGCVRGRSFSVSSPRSNLASIERAHAGECMPGCACDRRALRAVLGRICGFVIGVLHEPRDPPCRWPS